MSKKLHCMICNRTADHPLCPQCKPKFAKRFRKPIPTKRQKIDAVVRQVVAGGR